MNDELGTYIYTRSRRDRRAAERRVLAALRDSGCRCRVTITPDANGLGGSHVHEMGCPLGDRLDALALVGRPQHLSVVDPIAARPATGASVEVIRHHGREHARHCELGGVDERLCACGTAILIVCASCDEAVYVAVPPGEWCEHAAEAMAR